MEGIVFEGCGWGSIRPLVTQQELTKAQDDTLTVDNDRVSDVL